MFRKLKELFSSDSLLNQAFENCSQMLQECRDMCEKSIHALRYTESNLLEFDIYKMDKSVNHFERSVRRKILTHISVSGTSDLASSLILLTIIVDMERIGDYSKNIVELALNHPQQLAAGTIEEALKEIEQYVLPSFSTLQDILQQADLSSAREFIEKNHAITKRCDAWVMQLLRGELQCVTAGTCAALALYIRYLKRIFAHQMNIASSVVNPYDRIRYRDED